MNILKIACSTLIVQVFCVHSIFALSARYQPSPKEQSVNPILNLLARTVSVRMNGIFHCDSGCAENVPSLYIHGDGTYSKGTESGTYRITGIQKDSQGNIRSGDLFLSNSQNGGLGFIKVAEGTAKITFAHPQVTDSIEQSAIETWIKR